ncbi:MAG: sigma-70 family RNA polymerase sigma factor [Eubacteriales bacterium]
MSQHDYSSNTRLVELARNGDKDAFDVLIRDNMGLVKSIALRFRDRGVEFDDLMQIGTLGMIKAVRSFDSSFGTVFSTYAVPMIIGEIKRFLRDDNLIKISRDTKRDAAGILKLKEQFVSQYGREPQSSELAELADMSVEQLIYTLEAVAPVHSLQESVGDGEDGASLENFIGSDDIDGITTRLAIREAVENLPQMQRELITLRYFRGLSQQQTAKILGITQVKVSREEKKIFSELKKVL